MQKVTVINLSRVTQQVGVRHEDGKKDMVQIMPRGRTELRDGMEIDARWLSMNPDVVKCVKGDE